MPTSVKVIIMTITQMRSGHGKRRAPFCSWLSLRGTLPKKIEGRKSGIHWATGILKEALGQTRPHGPSRAPRAAIPLGTTTPSVLRSRQLTALGSRQFGAGPQLPRRSTNFCARPKGILQAPERKEAWLPKRRSTNLAMGHNLCLHCGADEHPSTTYFDAHQGYRVLTHSSFCAHPCFCRCLEVGAALDEPQKSEDSPNTGKESHVLLYCGR